MGCTNRKDKPRTPSPKNLQNSESDGDAFWAKSREAAPLQTADPFQTVDLTNSETVTTAAPAAVEEAKSDLAGAFGAPPAPALVAADAFGAPPTPVLTAPVVARAASIDRVPPGAAVSPPPALTPRSLAALAAETPHPHDLLNSGTRPGPGTIRAGTMTMDLGAIVCFITDRLVRGPDQ